MSRALFWPIEHPAQAAVLIMVLTVGLAAQLPGLQLDTSPESLMAVNDPARHHYEEFTRRFGSDVVALVVIKAEDIFTAPILRAVQRLSDALERLDDVTRVESLTTVRNIKGDADTLTTEPLVERTIPEEAEALRKMYRERYNQ